MKKALLFAFTLSVAFSKAQIYPYTDGFETYTDFVVLGNQGGHNSDLVVEPLHGLGQSKGLVAKMDNTTQSAFVESPAIGPLTNLSHFSFRYRVMDIASYPSSPGVLGAGDRIEVFAKSEFTVDFFSILTIDGFNHQVSTGFKTISIPCGSAAGAEVQFRVVVTKASTNTFIVDMDDFSLSDNNDTSAHIIIKPVITQPTCYGESNGSISLLLNGGIPPYRYYWSEALPGTANQPNVGAGSYFVTIIDSAGNAASAPLVVSQPQPIVLSTTPVNVVCHGADHGSIDLTVHNAIAPVTFAWSNQSNTEDLASLPAGVYTATVTDFFNCTALVTEEITQPVQFEIIENHTPVSSPQANDGSITVTVVGGTPSYQFTIDGTNYASSNEFTSLEAGCYTITVKDSRNCMFSSEEICIEEDPITLGTEDLLNPEVVIYPNPANQFVEIKTTALSGAEIMLINSLGEVVISRNQTMTTERFDISNLSQGNYIVYIGNDKTGIRKTISIVR